MERKAVKLNIIKNNSSLSFERYCNRFGIPTHLISLAVVVILYFVNGIFSTVGIVHLLQNSICGGVMLKVGAPHSAPPWSPLARQLVGKSPPIALLPLLPPNLALPLLSIHWKWQHTHLWLSGWPQCPLFGWLKFIRQHTTLFKLLCLHDMVFKYRFSLWCISKAVQLIK